MEIPRLAANGEIREGRRRCRVTMVARRVTVRHRAACAPAAERLKDETRMAG